MNILEKSKEYAEGKALNAITTAIEEAYAAGYQEGYEDGYANREKPASPIKYKSFNYIDLDLPSGTKWATNYLTKTNGEIELLSFSDARSLFIPTRKQFQELLDNTEQLLTIKDGRPVTEFVSSRNGYRFCLPNGQYKKNGVYDKDNYLFWVKETLNSIKPQCAFGPTIQIWNSMFLYYLPVVLVSKCDTSNEE